MKKNLIAWSSQCQMGRNYFSLSPAAGEIIGSRFMRELGIGSATTKILPTPEADELPSDGWIIKRKIQVGAGQSLAIQKITEAISLTFLRSIHGVESQLSRWSWEHDLEIPKALLFLGVVPNQKDAIADNMRLILHFGKDGGLNARFYRDFVPQDMPAIQQAIQWDSEQMMEIHAARLLLGTSAAHGGNILVDGQGTLYSIDHEKTYWSNGSDIEMLAEHIRRPSRAHAAIRRVANRLRDRDIDRIFDDLPDHPWPLGKNPDESYILGSKATTVAYFQQRLHAFQEKFPA